MLIPPSPRRNFSASLVQSGSSFTEQHEETEELEDLETVYRCITERENDFKVAAEIGQMLVQKNQQLMEDVEEVTMWKEQVARLLPLCYSLWHFFSFPHLVMLQYDAQREANNEILTTLERLESENHRLAKLNDEQTRTLTELRAVLQASPLIKLWSLPPTLFCWSHILTYSQS